MGTFPFLQKLLLPIEDLSDFSETRLFFPRDDCLQTDLTSQWILIHISLCNTAKKTYHFLSVLHTL